MRALLAITFPAIVCTAIVFAASPAGAHHSPAAYDLRPEVSMELQGRVTRVQWARPHVYVYLEAPSEGGESIVWQIEVDTPSNMERHGWFRDSLVPGDSVTAEVFPPRDASRRIAKLLSFEKADGVRLSYIDPELLDVTEPAVAKATSLSGTWAPSQLAPESPIARLQEQLIALSFGVDVGLPLTEKGMDAVRGFTDELSPTIDCIPRTAPSTTMYSSGLHSIDVRDDVVLLRENWFGTVRAVYLDVASHDDAPYSIQGHSFGRWEGAVLVVDSARFSEHREGLFNKLPSSENKHLIERFSLNSDGKSLTYSWVLTDYEYLTQIVSGRNQWMYRPDLEFSTSECSLESARQFLED